MTEDNEEAADALLAAALAEDSDQVPPPRDFVSMRLADDWDPPARQASRPSSFTHDRMPAAEAARNPRRSALQLIEHLLCHPELDWLRRAQFSPSITQPLTVKPRGHAARAADLMTTKMAKIAAKTDVKGEGKSEAHVLTDVQHMEDRRRDSKAPPTSDKPELKLVELLTTSSLKANAAPIRPDPLSQPGSSAPAALLKEIEVQVVRGRPLEIVHANGSRDRKKMDVENLPLLIVPCDGDAPGGQWMVAGPTSGDEDETDIFTSSTCYPQLWPTRLKNVLPLKADHALLLQSVLLFRTGEGARLREDANSWRECAALFIPFVNRNVAENIAESATDRTRRAHDEELRSLNGAPVDVSTAARRARDAVNAAATDIGVALGSFGGILAGVVSGQGSRPTPESEAEAKSQAAKATAGKRLTEQLRFTLEAARHRGYRNIILPLGRWVRAGFSAIEVGQRLAQAIGMVEDSAFASMSRGSSGNKDEHLFRMTVICPSTVASFWMPSIESALASSRVRRREERASAESSRTTDHIERGQLPRPPATASSIATTSGSSSDQKQRSRSSPEGHAPVPSESGHRRERKRAREHDTKSAGSDRSGPQPTAAPESSRQLSPSNASRQRSPSNNSSRHRSPSNSSTRENRNESKRKESHRRRSSSSLPSALPNAQSEGKRSSNVNIRIRPTQGANVGRAAPASVPAPPIPPHYQNITARSR
jgi:hypothetical protein